jgi:hypothetical protein
MILVSRRKKVMGGRFGGRKPSGQPRGRWKDAGWTDDVDWLQIRNWKAAVRKKDDWGIGEAMSRKWAEAP